MTDIASLSSLAAYGNPVQRYSISKISSLTATSIYCIPHTGKQPRVEGVLGNKRSIVTVCNTIRQILPRSIYEYTGRPAGRLEYCVVGVCDVTRAP